jgi:hypothetical protein
MTVEEEEVTKVEVSLAVGVAAAADTAAAAIDTRTTKPVAVAWTLERWWSIMT